VYYFLYTTSCILLPVYYFLFTTSCLLLPVYYFLFTTSCILLSVYYFLYVHLLLQLCADYADVGVTDATLSQTPESLFDSLIFLVRDWQNGDEYGELPNEFIEIVGEPNLCLHFLCRGRV